MQGTTFGPALFAIGDGTAQRGCLRISDGRVVEVDAGMRRADRELPPGSVVTPGLIDLHVNGTGRSWFNTEPLETLRAMSAQAPRFGVTSFLPSVMTGPWDHMLRAAGIISKEARTPMSGARSLGLHLEGPFLNPEYRRVHPREFLLTPTPARIEALLGTWQGGRLRVTMAPELEEARPAAAELRRRGASLAAGHSGATYAIGNTAIEEGYRILTHTFNAMPPLHHRVSSLLTAYLLDPAVFCEVIADGIHVSAEHLALLYRLKGVNLILTTDHMPLTDGLVEQGGVARTKDGVIAGSRLTMDQAVRNLIAATGITLAEAVECATWAPARALGVEDEIGTLAPRARADFVVWSRRHEVTHVFIGGELVYTNS